MQKIVKFCKAQPVLAVAFIASLVTVPIVPPDSEYLTYCNRTVLIQLFCLMATVAGLRSIGVFENVTSFMLRRGGNLRRLGMLFTVLCFFSSMLVTNDVALLTFVPLTLLVYERIPDEKSRILTIVLETAAANLGSMITPFGNPQNLFLYEKYSLSAGEFFRTMLPAGAISLIMLLLLCLLLPPEKCTAKGVETHSVEKRQLAVYIFLFAVCLLTVFHAVPDWLCLIITVSLIFFCNKNLLKKVDYALLATFVCFFVFVGNIARISSVSEFFSRILTDREIIVSALLSQVISNVPASVMLSGFTENGKSLLLGVNLGGLGTVIASLASLISFQYYRQSDNADSKKYMLTFSAVNFGLLIVLLLLAVSGVL